MTIVAASGDPPPPDAVARAVEALVVGEVVVIPTDTVYGLAVDPARPGATDRLFALKQRPAQVALPVLVASIDQALALAADDVAPVAGRLMERWWPGGLTLVVRRRDGIDLDLGGDPSTVGLRLPAHPVPVVLAGAVGPLAVTSANLHGLPTAVTAGEVVDQLGSVPGMVVLDAGPCSGQASTVVSCVGEELRVLREGAIAAAEVLATAR